ncbi:MAG: hypothetical protein ACRD2E_04085 [Terriglobales bacterium]
MSSLPLSSQELAAQMNQRREAIGATVERLRLRLRRDLDVPRQLANHSGLALAVAASAGWLAGRMLRRMLG